jgi:hypothetical protein
VAVDLRDRLRAALSQPVRAGPLPRAESVTVLTDLSGLGGHWFQSEQGPGYLIESSYEAGYSHGNVVLHRAITVDAPTLAGQCRDERLSAIAPGSFVYVDTETTGLGGAGALVFLAGVARFEGSVLKLRQYLLPGPQYEGGLLGGLAGELATAPALVSYNGKSFDLPLLEARYILSRERPTFRQLPHLDLLHPNRRLFRGSFESHRLPVMEQELLGFARDQDCPSAEVPERYFRFQRSGDPTPILPVLRHNAWDVLSLVALAAHLGEVCGGEAFPLQAARAAAYARDPEAVLRYAVRALQQPSGRPARLEALERAARACRELGQYQDAARWWQELIAEPRNRRLLPYVELAKLREHQLKDRSGAISAVEAALDLARRGLAPQGPANSESTIVALEKRLARLTAVPSTAGGRQ